MYLFSIKESLVEKGATYIMNVGNPLEQCIASGIIQKFTVQKSLIYVRNVGNPIGKALASLHTKEFILE